MLSTNFIFFRTMAQLNLGIMPDEDMNDIDAELQDLVQDQEQARGLQVGANWDVPVHLNREPIEFNQGYGPVHPEVRTGIQHR